MATFSGSREFHKSSAVRTFVAAVSRVNGGSGGRTEVGAATFSLIVVVKFFPSLQIPVVGADSDPGAPLNAVRNVEYLHRFAR